MLVRKVDFLFQALSIQSNNGKALYRRAQARMGLRDYDSAVADLRRALVLCPNDKIIWQQLKKATATKRNYLETEKSFFTRMLSKS